MNKVVPIHGHFENAKAFLHHIAEDDQIAQFVIFIMKKDGTPTLANFEMKRSTMAYASVVLADEAISD